MARQESEREDLLGEAKALVERIELIVRLEEMGRKNHVVVGFRRDGCASIYIGSDPVYHFNSQRQLRRAFVDSRLLKAQRGELVSMQRVRRDGQVQLISRTLSTEKTSQFLNRIERLLLDLERQLAAANFEVVGQVPADVDVLGRVAGWLEELDEISIARSPHAR